MKKTILTVLMLILIAVCAFISIANFTSTKANAKATFGRTETVTFFWGLAEWEFCTGDPSNCCVVTP